MRSHFLSPEVHLNCTDLRGLADCVWVPGDIKCENLLKLISSFISYIFWWTEVKTENVDPIHTVLQTEWVGKRLPSICGHLIKDTLFDYCYRPTCLANLCIQLQTLYAFFFWCHIHQTGALRRRTYLTGINATYCFQEFINCPLRKTTINPRIVFWIKSSII